MHRLDVNASSEEVPQSAHHANPDTVLYTPLSVDGTRANALSACDQRYSTAVDFRMRFKPGQTFHPAPATSPARRLR